MRLKDWGKCEIHINSFHIVSIIDLYLINHVSAETTTYVLFLYNGISTIVYIMQTYNIRKYWNNGSQFFLYMGNRTIYICHLYEFGHNLETFFYEIEIQYDFYHVHVSSNPKSFVLLLSKGCVYEAFSRFRHIQKIA